MSKNSSNCFILSFWFLS